MFFFGPSTFTGEDCCEFHVHGGPAVISSVLEALDSLPGNKMAEPGEFSKRAFFNGKMDLTAVEGFSDLLEAETKAQQRLALRQSAGNLNKLYKKWRAELVDLTANLEAHLDFGEEHFLDETLPEQVRAGVSKLCERVKSHLSRSRSAERVRSGVQAVLLGPPNVGKSSLLNLISQRPAAIVTAVPGTTRDTVYVRLNLGGYPLTLTDTAGIRETNDIVEIEGVDRAKQKAQEADILLLLLEAHSIKNEADLIEKLDVTLEFLREDFDAEIVLLLNKADLLGRDSKIPISAVCWRRKNVPVLCLSCLTQAGLQELLSDLTDMAEKLCASSFGENPTFTNLRHRLLVQEIHENLEQFQEYFDRDLVISAEKLRCAIGAIGKITGVVCTEEVLEAIFNNFCIGK